MQYHSCSPRSGPSGWFWWEARTQSTNAADGEQRLRLFSKWEHWILIDAPADPQSCNSLPRYFQDGIMQSFFLFTFQVTEHNFFFNFMYVSLWSFWSNLPHATVVLVYVTAIHFHWGPCCLQDGETNTCCSSHTWDPDIKIPYSWNYFLKLLYHLFIFLFIFYVCECACAMVYRWKSED